MFLKKKITLGVVATLAATCAVGGAWATNVQANAEEVRYVVNSGSSLTAGYADGEYSLSGRQVRGRSGMVINQEINYNHTLSFDMQLQLNNTFNETENARHNRQWDITLHEYNITEAGLPNAANNIYSQTGIYGAQVRIYATPSDVRVSMLAQNAGQSYTVTEESDPYFWSYFFGGEVGGVTAKSYAHMELYYSNAEGDKVMQDEATSYTLKMQCYDNTTGELAGTPILVSAAKEKMSPEGGFRTQPYLGMFCISEAGSTTTTLDMDWKIFNIDNGRVKNFSIQPSEVIGLKPNENVTLQPVLTAFDSNDTLKDITISYTSNKPEVISVNEKGVLSTTADGGSAIITAMTSEGNVAKVNVVVYDAVAPVLTINGDVPQTATQYDKVVLPTFTASDNSNEFIATVAVVSPELYDIDENAEEYSFVPTLSGAYVVKYSVKDAMNNETAYEYEINVAEDDASGFWTKEQKNNSHIIINENADGSVMKAEMQLGLPGVTDESSALIYSNQPLTFTKNANGTYNSVSFDISVKYKAGSYDSTKLTDISHNFTFYLMEAYENGTISSEAFTRGRYGMENFISHWPYATEAGTTLRYRLRTAGNAKMTEQHTSVIDTYSEDETERAQKEANRNNMYGMGSTYLPWFEYGDALNFAKKYLSGEKFTVKVEYFDETVTDPEGKESVKFDKYYKWTFDGFSLCVPADDIAGSEDGYRRQAYLGFKAITTNGEANYTIEVSNLRNGSVRSVGFEEGKQITVNYGEEYSLTPKAFGYNGETIPSKFTYSSNDESIAKVDANGKVKIVGYGTAVISAVEQGEKKQGMFTISVKTPMFLLSRDEYTVKVGKDFILPVITGTDLKVPYTMTVSDSYGLVALETGALQAVRVGDYTVTVTYLGEEISCTIHVVESDEQAPIEKPIIPDTPNDSTSSSTNNGGNTQQSSGCGGSIALSTLTLGLLGAFGAVYLKKKKED